jgi:hypothetical protein
MSDQTLPHAAEAALPLPTCSARFHYDSESGFIYDNQSREWLTSAEEVFHAMYEDAQRLRALADGLKRAACALPLGSEGYRIAIEIIDLYDTQPNAKLSGPDQGGAT